MSGIQRWERLGHRFLTNVEGPTMRWGLEINHYHIVTGDCAGVIAAWPKTDNVVRPITQIASSDKQYMCLFSSNGSLLGKISLDFGNVVETRVLSDETVVIATDAGIVRHYAEFGLNFSQMQLASGISEIKPYDDGYFVKFEQNYAEGESSISLGFVSKCRASEPSFRDLGSIKSLFTAEGWVLVAPDKDSGRSLRHLFIDELGKVHIFDSELSEQSHQIVFQNAPVGFLKLSPNEELIAFSDGKQKLTILTSDLYEVDFECESIPSHVDIYWLSSSVIGLKNCELGEDGSEIVKLEVIDVRSLAPQSDLDIPTIFFEDESVALIEEVDGLRVLGSLNHSISMPVSKATSDIFKVASKSPSSKLFDCAELIDSGSPISEQTVKSLSQNELNSAVETCITAALNEIEPKIQRRLMRAASFGKTMLNAYDSTRYLRALSYLRIGNALRSLGDKGLFITNAEIERLTMPTIIKRLLNRQFWGEAISLAEIMQLPIEPIYIEWACSVIQNDDQATDEELLKTIEVKLKKLHAYSRSKMALKAIEQGRQDLALNLLETEPVLSDRIVLLLEMGNTQQALQQAVKSGNPFLIDYVLAVLTKQLSLPQMIRVIGGNMTAVNRQTDLIRASSLSNGEDNLKSDNKIHEYLHQMDLRPQSVKLEFKSVIGEKDNLLKIRVLESLHKKFASISKKYTPESKVCSEWAELLTLQRQLSENYELDLVGKSAAETLYALLKITQITQAQKLKTKLGISDRQFMWLRMKALVDRREFEDLWDLSQTRKPLISPQSYFNMCFEAGNKEQASRYVHLIADATPEEKVKMYVKCESFDLARTMAARNIDLLSLIP